MMSFSTPSARFEEGCGDGNGVAPLEASRQASTPHASLMMAGGDVDEARTREMALEAFQRDA